LFSEVHAVYEVAEECEADGHIKVPPLHSLSWVKLVKSQEPLYQSVLLELDKGEKHTLNMACQFKADKVIIDEKIGRNMAEYLGLNVVGTLGILLAACWRRLKTDHPYRLKIDQGEMLNSVLHSIGIVDQTELVLSPFFC
jgi:predicted nucleic acid-binding protein